MTAGEYLVAHSSLPSGTALEHLLALQVGTGTGIDKVIYCSQITTLVEQQEIAVTRKPKRAAPEPVAAQQPVAEKRSKQQRNFFAFSSQRAEVVYNTGVEKVFILRRSKKI